MTVFSQVWRVSVTSNGFVEPMDIDGPNTREPAGINRQPVNGPDLRHDRFNVARELVIDRCTKQMGTKASDNDSCYLCVGIFGPSGELLRR
jgi:hypothetical protein